MFEYPINLDKIFDHKFGQNYCGHWLQDEKSQIVLEKSKLQWLHEKALKDKIYDGYF